MTSRDNKESLPSTDTPGLVLPITYSPSTNALNASLQAALKSVFTELDAPTTAVDPNINKCQALRQYAFSFYVKQCNERSTHAYVGWDDYDIYDYDDYDVY
tara:strand:+ start:357 stop:659 length:303 start_codon:yes stop_codon:yes gene_type:complete